MDFKNFISFHPKIVLTNLIKSRYNFTQLCTIKSKKKIIQYLVKAAGYNSNLLLNVGPMPNGRIQKEHISILREVGDWLKVYGKTIYNTRGGPIKTTDEIS